MSVQLEIIAESTNKALKEIVLVNVATAMAMEDNVIKLFHEIEHDEKMISLLEDHLLKSRNSSVEFIHKNDALYVEKSIWKMTKTPCKGKLMI